MKKPKSKRAPSNRRQSDEKGQLAKRVVTSFEESPEALEDLAKVVQTETSVTFAGPLPPPQILSGYEDALPGAADRIIAMAEANNDANIAIANSALSNDLIYKVAGMACGLIAMLALIGGAIYCASIGEIKVTYALLGVGALGTVPVFVNAWSKNKAEPPRDNDQ